MNKETCMVQLTGVLFHSCGKWGQRLGTWHPANFPGDLLSLETTALAFTHASTLGRLLNLYDEAPAGASTTAGSLNVERPQYDSRGVIAVGLIMVP